MLVAQRQQRMSRAVRTLRGVLISGVSSLLAAASHSLAGGTITFEAVIATFILALPLCVAFAGRIASLWRVAAAVGLSQFFYHWTFAGLGVMSEMSQDANRFPPGPHAAHMASLERFVPAVTQATSADAVMWIFHGIAAAASIVVITRGERAVLTLLRSIRHVLPRPVVRPVIHTPRVVPAVRSVPVLRDQLLLGSACGRRGPPLAA